MIPRPHRVLVALVVALLAASAHAQFAADATLTLLTPEVAVGEPARVEVDKPPGLDFDLEVRWGDGAWSVVDRFGPAVQTYTHAYATPGVRSIELVEPDPFAGTETLIDVAVVTVGSLAALDLRPAVVGVGERVAARVVAGPAGGRVDWGDGAFDVLAGGDATVEHAYGAPGAYTVRLLDASGATLDVGVASVTADPLAFDLPAFGAVGVPVEAAVVGLAANAPAGARLDWGDGAVDVVLGDAVAEHAYARPGTFAVRLERLPDGAPLAVAAVVVEATGALAVVGDAVRFEPTRFEADALAPGFAYEVAFGDGAVAVGFADGAGRLAVEHRYTTPAIRATATLALVEQGQRTPLAELVVPLVLPAPSEALAATAAPDPVAGRIAVEVRATGLLPGLAYVVRSERIGERPLEGTGEGDAATARFELDREGSLALELAARLEVPGAGFVDEPRAATTLDAAWPRGTEVLALEAPPTPLLATDTVRVRADGLVPGYGYALVANGDAERAIVLARTDGAPWTVELPLALLGPVVDVELVVRYPGPALDRETRATLRVEGLVPTGNLALPTSVVPFEVPSPVLVRDLTPGVPYRVVYPDGSEERFVASVDGALDLEHAFAATAPVALFVDRAGADDEPIATATPTGVTLAGRLGYAVDVPRYLATGEVTMQVRGVAPGYTYLVEVGGGRRVEGVADADGALDLVVVEPGREARLFQRVFGGEPFVAQTRLDDLPPRVLRFFGGDGWQVRVTELATDEAGRADPSALTGRGVLEGFVVGGRLQDPVPMRFAGLRALTEGAVLAGEATLVEPLEVALPFAVQGVDLTLDGLVLGAFGTAPRFAGSVALPTGERQRFDRVLMPRSGPGDGFLITVFEQDGAERALPAGAWRYGIGEGSIAMVDLSVTSDYDLRRPDGRNALEHAYDGWSDAGRAPPLGERGAWVGVLYPDGALRTGGGDGVAPDEFRADLAWTSAGVSGFAERALGRDGVYEWFGWRFTDVTGLAVSVVDDQVVRFTRPSGRLRLDWFGQDVPVAFVPDRAGWSVRTLAPVAQDYGTTAVVGGAGAFVRVGLDRWALRFPNALWALDGDLAADPATVDASPGEALLESLPPTGDLGEDLTTLYDDAVATSETALNLYRLQLLLKDLTLHPDGSVDLGGAEWRTLARVPALDLFGFPYLGAGAEIGVRRSQGRYGIGLRGDLKVAEVVEATAAPSWFEHADGRAARWVFEGVGAKFGDFEGSPVTFAVALGGVIDVQRGDLSFTGAGALTIPDVVSVEAMATFGVIQQAAGSPDFFWFVGAGVDLAAMGRPINVNVSGVDVLAFYAFRGGLGSKLRLDVGDGPCRVDDGNVPQGVLPSIAANALECYDPDLALSLLAGTVIGSPVQGGAGSEGYGILWHLEANLVVNLGRGGDLQLAGRGWIGRSVADGYGQRGVAPEQLAGRLVVNAEGITGSLCAGPLATGAGVLDCSGLDPAELRAGGVLIAEFRGAIEFKASWATSQYYFALGTQRNPVYSYVIPRYVQGYLVFGYLRDPGILHPNVALPAGGAWVGAESGFRWDYEKSGSAGLCDWRVHAGAAFGFGGSLGVQAVPSFQVSAALTAHAWARAGGSVCGKGLDASASIRATGRLTAPNPTEFRGDFEVKIDLPVVPDIDVTVYDVGVRLN